MSETTAAPQQGQQQTPPLVVNIQYVKDLSFEVPGAPQIYTQLRAQPQVNINLDVQARRVQEGQSVYEVAIMIGPKPTRPLRRRVMARRLPCRQQCSWPNSPMPGCSP